MPFDKLPSTDFLRQAQDERQLDGSVRGELVEPQTESTFSAFPENVEPTQRYEPAMARARLTTALYHPFQIATRKETTHAS